MAIDVTYDDDEAVMINIDGEEYLTEDGESFIVPSSILLKQEISDLPIGIEIEVCESINDSIVEIKGVPTKFTKVGSDRFQAYFDDTTTRKYWNGVVGLNVYMETKRDIIKDRQDNLGDIILENYDDDGAYISMQYSCEITADSFNELLRTISQIDEEIEGATDIALGSPFEKIENCNKESDFTIKILLPLLRKLGFVNVKYNHGNKEYGKDITFARRTEFDEYEYYGVQVKSGDVSGGASGDINELISQARDSFSMPFYDVYSREKKRISKLVIAISGKYTLNAIEKIIEGITDYPLKNNIIFLDGEKIENLMERFRRF